MLRYILHDSRNREIQSGITTTITTDTHPYGNILLPHIPHNA